MDSFDEKCAEKDQKPITQPIEDDGDRGEEGDGKAPLEFESPVQCSGISPLHPTPFQH